MIVRAIPGAGKTWLARHRPGTEDSDRVLEQIAGERSSKASYERVRRTPDLFSAFRAALEVYQSQGLLLTNFEPSELGLACDVRVAYAPEDYVEHLKLAGRKDLLTKFTPEVLTAWAQDYSRWPNVVYLQKGYFLGDCLFLFEVKYLTPAREG